MAAAATHIDDDLLHAVPILACGPRLNYGTTRMAFGLRLGSEIGNRIIASVNLRRFGRYSRTRYTILRMKIQAIL